MANFPSNTRETLQAVANDVMQLLALSSAWFQVPAKEAFPSTMQFSLFAYGVHPYANLSQAWENLHSSGSTLLASLAGKGIAPNADAVSMTKIEAAFYINQLQNLDHLTGDIQLNSLLRYYSIAKLNARMIIQLQCFVERLTHNESHTNIFKFIDQVPAGYFDDGYANDLIAEYSASFGKQGYTHAKYEYCSMFTFPTECANTFQWHEWSQVETAIAGIKAFRSTVAA